MRQIRTRAAIAALLSAVAVVATACPPPSSVPKVTRTFAAESVTVESANDDCVLFVCIYKDEPKVIHIGFRATMGVKDSADVQVVVGSHPWPGAFDQGPGAGQSHTFTGTQRGAVSFTDISTPDILEFAAGAPLDVVGVWAWKVEDDGVLAANANRLANLIATALEPALNQTLAAAKVPEKPEDVVEAVLTAVGNIGFFDLFSAAFTTLQNNLNILSDDVVGSAMYLGVGAKGTFATIIDEAAKLAPFPAIAIPTLNTPPDVGGGAIFSLGSPRTFENAFINDGVDGRHRTRYSFG